jgi:CRISPR-associated endonuclease/helicase Cas3
MFLRLVFSALIDADHLDTERHFRPETAAERAGTATITELRERFQRYHRRFEGAGQDAVARMRHTVYEACLAAAELPPGIFRLTVPTGGGKTLSSMAFALRHALRHGQRRVIVAVPFISITEQTAKAYRDALERGQEAGQMVLEHHSAAERLERDDEDHQTAAVWARLAAENWDAPIVVTTTVQLFESLFANRPNRCRKLHRLARSVIILDEAQALPPHLLRPILDGLRELAAHYGSSVVISTATQPAFEAIPDFAGIPAEEMAPDPVALFAGLRRVDYDWRIDPPLSWGDVARLMAGQRQALLVVNTKGNALSALDALDDPGALHLSTLLCGAHRLRVIREIGRRLQAGEPCRVVSTQVIEAGVDLDFPAVLRAMGPLDSIIQAAGRCNREGHLSKGHMLVFRPAEGGLPRGSYRPATDITASLLGRDTLDPHDPAVAREYFQLLFQTVDTDREQIQNLRESFNYPEVARRFRMIDDDTVGLVVTRYGSEAERRRVRELTEQLRQGYPEARLLRRRLEPYVVSVFARKADEYERKGLLAPITPGLYEWLGDYDRVRGITERDLDADSLVV